MKERGASAVLVALSMLLLLGVAAVALDMSAAFNERNQDQTAGDNGVMAGAIEKAEPDPDAQLMAVNALAIVQANLTAEFPGGATDPDWIALWRGCVDDGNPNWVPLPEPLGWGNPGATLDCISQTTSLLRVRVPDQLTDTAFGGLLGLGSLTTNAVSIAKTVLLQTAPPLVPFGIAGDASAGELCLASSGSGTAYEPCTGPQTGSFGSIISPLFGDFGSHAAECSGNTNDWFTRNVIFGIDHKIEDWPSAPLTTGPYPGQTTVLASEHVYRDACVLDPDGNAAPLDPIDFDGGHWINTMLVDTGYPNPALTDGLASDILVEGRPSRLQQPGSNPTGDNATRVIWDQNDPWELDNVGPWMYLNDKGPPKCQYSNYYDGSGVPKHSGLTAHEERLADFESCLAQSDGEIFDTSIADSPRFVWVPQYAYQLPVSGQKFNPIREFRAAFLGGTWWNCSSSSSTGQCAFVFYPDQEESGELCDPAGPGCKKVSVSQLSAWLLPSDSIPKSLKDAFRDAYDKLEPELYQ